MIVPNLIKMVGLPEWMTQSYLYKQGGRPMADLIKKKGRVWYANCTYMKVLLRQSLKTTDQQIAIERIAETFMLIREGRYQFYLKKFDDMVLEFDPQINRKNKLMNLRNHIIPEFQGKRLSEIDIQSWAEKIAANHVKSTALSIICPAVEMGFEVNYRNIDFKEGRKFDGSQILTEEMAVQILDKIKSGPRSRKYHGICHVALYSTMSLSDLLHLTKSQVVFSGEDAGITYTRRKTRYKNKKPLFIPMTNKLLEAFRGLITPIFPEERWFPPMNTSTVSSAVGRAFKACGWKHGGAMHNFRHFGACYLLKHGVTLPTIQEIFGHSNFNTTLIYARTDRETVKEGMRKFDVK